MPWLVALMRYLTLFSVVSLIVAVAWTNLQTPAPLPVHVPGPAPVDGDPVDGDPVEADPVELDPVADPVTPPAPESGTGPPAVIVATGGSDPNPLDPGASGEAPTASDTVETTPDAVVDVQPDVVPVIPVVPVEIEHPGVPDVASVPPVLDVPDSDTDTDEVGDEVPIARVQRGRQLVGQITDTSGRPLPHVQIRLTDRDDALNPQFVTANADGVFVAKGLQPGPYLVAVVPRSVPGDIARPAAPGLCRVGDEPPGFGSVCVDILDSTKVTTVALVLPFRAVVQGNIAGADGGPARGALVRAVSRVPGFERVNELVRADEDGRFSLHLVPGPYDLQVLVHGSDDGGELVCSLRLDAAEGALQFLETIDFSSPDELPSGGAEASAPLVAVSEDGFQSWPIAASAPAPGHGYAISEGVESVVLEGRIMTRWGESVESVIVACFDMAGDEIVRDASDATGTYVLADVPVGRAIIRVGMNDVPDDLATTLLHRTLPLIVDIPAAAPRAILEDITVDVDRVFRVAGRVKIDSNALAVFQMQLIERDAVLASLTEDRVRSTFLRGLQLTVSRVGEHRRDRRPVFVEDDGSFHWSTRLPSSDVAFRLEPRSDRLGALYAGKAVRPVTPAGVATTEIVIEYPVEHVLDAAFMAETSQR